MSKPWMKFYPADWRDSRLRRCSLAARGLWIDLMTYMHEAEPYGHLLMADRPPTISEIALQLARPMPEVKRAMAELEENGVFSKNDFEIIYSRRMVRDFQKAETDKANGKSGGNPHLRGWVNPPDKPNVNGYDNGEDKAQWSLSSPSLTSSGGPLNEAKEGEEELTDTRDGWNFDEWYELYPHKVGKDAARRAFEKRRKSKTVDFITLKAGLLRYAAKTDDRPWCNPATWLNEGRWEDQPAENAGKTNGTHWNGSPIGGREGQETFATFAVRNARAAAGSDQSGD